MIATGRAVWYNLFMNTELDRYAGRKICVACSGGRDSMALLHCLCSNAKKWNITVSALNCDHGIRGEQSSADSAFVREWCEKNAVPLTFFKAQGFASEGEARAWRLQCYLKVAPFVDCVATAHHLDDNAETVLFNLSRGTALSGMCGITDVDMSHAAGKKFFLIRPLINCSRREIDIYIAQNGVPYVDDETNFSDDYTRNKIRHNALPALEQAVPGASEAIYRFSRLAAQDEEYFIKAAAPLVKSSVCGYTVSYCSEKSVFARAVYDVVARRFLKKDYTSLHFDALYGLQSAENGKKFFFLGLTAYKEQGRLRIISDEWQPSPEAPLGEFLDGRTAFSGFALEISAKKLCPSEGVRVLRADEDKIPVDAVVRTMKAGDVFKKFGGGTKSLGDFFTDKKIPLALRDKIPLIASGNEIYVVCGVEISDKVRTEEGGRTIYIGCPDFCI